MVPSSPGVFAGAVKSRAPSSPASRITARWVSAEGTASTAMPAATAIVAVARVAAMPRAIAETAWKTTATAAASSPAVQPAAGASISRAKAANSTAEGRVKANQAAAIPPKPARW